MEFHEVPKDLIERAQILLRSEAGLQSYNPTHPSLPSVEEIIAGFDPSPGSLQCTHCNTKLLRGSQSLLCVYCGRQLSPEISPHPPMSFNSTTGFRWLLESLALDGLEIVQPSEEDGKMNRGRNPVKDGISLSDYLNLEMKWPAEAERFGLTDADELKLQRPLQLAGMSFIDASPEKKLENSFRIPPQQGVSSEKSIEFDAFLALGSLHLSENQEFCDVKPSEGKHDVSLSVWQADFQAASSVAPHDDLESSHPLKIPSVDYSSPMDSVTNNWLQKTQQQTKSLESNDNKMGVIHDSFDSWEVHKGAAGIGNDQGLTNSTFVSSSAKSCIYNDAFESDVWNDFASSAGSGDNQNQTSSISAPKEDVSFDAWNGFTSSGIVPDDQLANRGVNSAEEMSVSVGNDMFGPWNDVISLTSVQESQQKEYGEIGRSTETATKDSVEFGSDYSSLSDQGDKLKNPRTPSVDKMNEKDEESIDLWDNFMGSTVVQQNPGESNRVKLTDGQLNGKGEDRAVGLDDFTRVTDSCINEQKINSAETHRDKKTDESDDSFESWNAFTNSASRPENKSINEDSAWAWGGISNHNIQQEVIGEQAFEVKTVTENDDSLSSWSDFTSSSNPVSNKNQAITSENNITSADLSSQSWNDFPSSMDKAGEEHTSGVKVSETNVVEDNDVFNSLFSLTSSSGLLNNQWHDADGFFSDHSSSRLTSTKGAVDHQLTMGGDSIPDNQAVARHDPFHAWNLLMSSPGSQNNTKNVAFAEHASETSLFNSPASMESAGLSSATHPLMLPDGVSSQIASANLDISSSKNLDLFRVKNGDAKSSITEQSEKVEHALEETSRKKPIDAEALISQMHDLSFMLESSLPVPKKVD